MSERTQAAAGGSWQIGRYRFHRRTRRQTSMGRRWGVSSHGRGVDFCRTPLGALRALWRFEKEPLRPPGRSDD